MFKKSTLLITLIIIGLSPINANDNNNEIKIKNSINRGLSGVKEILKKVPINKLYSDNKTLLHYAVELDKYDVVSFLVYKDILLSQKGGIFYGTALQEAIYYGYPDIATFLIEQDTPLNIQDINGDTALHIASRNGDLDTISTLLSHGANKTICNNNGYTPYDLIPSLNWDSVQEIKSLLIINNKKNKFQYPTLEFDTQLENTSLQHTENKTINHVDTQSHITNSNLGINIKRIYQ